VSTLQLTKNTILVDQLNDGMISVLDHLLADRFVQILKISFLFSLADFQLFYNQHLPLWNDKHVNYWQACSHADRGLIGH
jgi:hypothetical protein